jgi:hypothetical protein
VVVVKSFEKRVERRRRKNEEGEWLAELKFWGGGENQRRRN